MAHPIRLTTDEWNFLIDLTTHNHMDSWCEFREYDDKDMVYDLDNDKLITLREALIDISEGVVYDDIIMLNGEEIWKGLCEKFEINTIDNSSEI